MIRKARWGGFAMEVDLLWLQINGAEVSVRSETVFASGPFISIRRVAALVD
jgi:hypothetical protein